MSHLGVSVNLTLNIDEPFCGLNDNSQAEGQQEDAFEECAEQLGSLPAK